MHVNKWSVHLCGQSGLQPLPISKFLQPLSRVRSRHHFCDKTALTTRSIASIIGQQQYIWKYPRALPLLNDQSNVVRIARYVKYQIIGCNTNMCLFVVTIATYQI